MTASNDSEYVVITEAQWQSLVAKIDHIEKLLAAQIATLTAMPTYEEFSRELGRRTMAGGGRPSMTNAIAGPPSYRGVR